MLKTILLSLGAALAAILVLFFVVIGRERTWELVAGSPDPEPYDFASARRSPTNNDALACSEGLCAEPDFTIAAFEEPVEAVIEGFAQKLLSADSLARRIDDRNDPTRARFVTYSPLMRFPDTIDLAAQKLPDGRTGVMAYARAQLGREDFGKNRLRLEALFGES
ncbi:DUF1499 domain-containing protein [Hoeflea sp.]|uniref:DUF1499 domain-containing protein n=1 Tax=Hoeflea sp. TaxID=1940281 RepID=UPI003B51B813